MNLKPLRMKLGLTQKQLADQMETTQQTVARWETEKTPLNAAHIRQLCAILQCTAEELMGWDDGSDAVAIDIDLNNFGDPFGTLRLGFAHGVRLFPIDENARGEVANFMERRGVSDAAENASDWLVVAALTRQMLFINPSALRTVGLVSDEIEAMPAFELVDNEQVELQSNYTDFGGDDIHETEGDGDDTDDEDFLPLAHELRIIMKDGAELIGALSPFVANEFHAIFANGLRVPSGAMILVESEEAGHLQTFVNLDEVSIIEVQSQALGRLLGDDR